MPKELTAQESLMLATGLWHDYAEQVQAISGHLPSQAPTSGDYYSGRTWAEYSPTLDIAGVRL